MSRRSGRFRDRPVSRGSGSMSNDYTSGDPPNRGGTPPRDNYRRPRLGPPIPITPEVILSVLGRRPSKLVQVAKAGAITWAQIEGSSRWALSHLIISGAYERLDDLAKSMPTWVLEARHASDDTPALSWGQL